MHRELNLTLCMVSVSSSSDSSPSSSPSNTSCIIGDPADLNFNDFSFNLSSDSLLLLILEVRLAFCKTYSNFSSFFINSSTKNISWMSEFVFLSSSESEEKVSLPIR
jgi:hypothetical protein